LPRTEKPGLFGWNSSSEEKMFYNIATPEAPAGHDAKGNQDLRDQDESTWKTKSGVCIMKHVMYGISETIFHKNLKHKCKM